MTERESEAVEYLGKLKECAREWQSHLLRMAGQLPPFSRDALLSVEDDLHELRSAATFVAKEIAGREAIESH